MGSLKGDWKDPNAIAHGTYVITATQFLSADGYIVRNRGTHPDMIYTDQEHEWLSKPKKKRVSNQTADGQPPEQDDRMYTRAWGIKTTIEVDGKTYIVPIQL